MARYRNIMVVVLCLFLVSCYNSEKLVDIKESEFYSINETKNSEYELNLIGVNGEIIESYLYPEEPIISEMDENILEIRLDLGNPNDYVQYYDTTSNKVSDVYYNPLGYGFGNVAYMKSDSELIVENIFTKECVLLVNRDFSKVAVPSLAIIDAKIFEDKIEIKYLQGTNFKDESETINFK